MQHIGTYHTCNTVDRNNNTTTNNNNIIIIIIKNNNNNNKNNKSAVLLDKNEITLEFFVCFICKYSQPTTSIIINQILNDSGACP
jgi:hypothetical protein